MYGFISAALAAHRIFFWVFKLQGEWDGIEVLAAVHGMVLEIPMIPFV